MSLAVCHDRKCYARCSALGQAVFLINGTLRLESLALWGNVHTEAFLTSCFKILFFIRHPLPLKSLLCFVEYQKFDSASLVIWYLVAHHTLCPTKPQLMHIELVLALFVLPCSANSSLLTMLKPCSHWSVLHWSAKCDNYAFCSSYFAKCADFTPAVLYSSLFNVLTFLLY